MTWLPQHPGALTAGFILASLVIIWRLERMNARGLERSALGALVTPYCSGLGNLLFVGIMLNRPGGGREVIINAVVNNLTNVTLILGLAMLIWPLRVVPKGRSKAVRRQRSLRRLHLGLTVIAALFFTGVAWALGRDGQLDQGDGLTLVGCFLFWQVFAIYDVMKGQAERRKPLSSALLVDGLLVVAAGALSYACLEGLTGWMEGQSGGFFRAERLGWITAWLMILPNALLAFYYAARGDSVMVLGSQLGDGHICIPLCIGLFALVQPAGVPEMFAPGMLALAGALVLHLVFILLAPGLPRGLGLVLVGFYALFTRGTF